MATKTTAKTTSSSSKKNKVTTTKKPVRAKKAVALESDVLKKVAVRSTKKRAVKKTTRKKPEVIVIEDIVLGANEPYSFPQDATKEYVVVHRCANCDHVPFSFSRLVTLFSVLIVLLSVSVLIQVGAVDVQRWIAFFAPVANASSVLFR